MPKPLITPDIPYRKYTRKEINNQPELSAAEGQLLCLMHELDRGDHRACYASNAYLANELGVTEGAVRNRVRRLHAKGYIITIGTELSGIANRRVRLKYGVKPDGSGAYTDTVVNGRVQRRKRKTGEANPIIFLINDEHTPCSPASIPPARSCEHQSVVELKKINSPISASVPNGPEADSLSFPSFSQTSSVVADDVTSDTRAKADVTPVTTTAPSKSTAPATLADLDTNPGRRGKPWLELANGYPGFREMCQRFGIANPDKATARSFIKRVKNHSQTFNSHTLRFVLDNLKTLDICPELGVKAPTALGDFLATFNAIATCLLRSKGFQLKSELDKLINGFTAGSFDPLETGTEFKKLQAAHGFKTFAEFYAFSQTNKSARALLWFAAMAFVAKGDLSVTEDPQAQVDVTRQIITTPELLNWVPPQLETATGCTAETLRGMRNAIYDQLVDSQRVFSDLPSVERILTLCDAIPGFIDEQIDAYVASQTVRDLAGELQGQAT